MLEGVGHEICGDAFQLPSNVTSAVKIAVKQDANEDAHDHGMQANESEDCVVLDSETCNYNHDHCNIDPSNLGTDGNPSPNPEEENCPCMHPLLRI